MSKISLASEDVQALQTIQRSIRSALDKVEESAPDPNDLEEWLDDWDVTSHVRPVFEHVAALVEESAYALSQAQKEIDEALAGVTA